MCPGAGLWLEAIALVSSWLHVVMVVADGYIAKPEMEQMLTAVYRVMFQARPSYAAAIGSTAAELAALSTRHCFAEADTNEDGKLRCVCLLCLACPCRLSVL